MSLYLTPKSSTTSVDCICRVSCLHSPGTNLLCRHPCLFSPTCGKPYIPLLVCLYIDPSSVSICCSSYLFMISSGMSLILICLKSGHFNGVTRSKFDLSKVMNFAFGVEIMLLISSFVTSMSAVGVATSPG